MVLRYALALAVLGLGANSAQAQSASGGDVCDDCKKRELSVGPGGDYSDLADAFCDFYPGDKIVVNEGFELTRPIVLDGDDERLCPGGKKGASVDFTIEAAGYGYEGRPISTKRVSISKAEDLDSAEWKNRPVLAL